MQSQIRDVPLHDWKTEGFARERVVTSSDTAATRVTPSLATNTRPASEDHGILPSLCVLVSIFLSLVYEFHIFPTSHSSAHFFQNSYTIRTSYF